MDHSAKLKKENSFSHQGFFMEKFEKNFQQIPKLALSGQLM